MILSVLKPSNPARRAVKLAAAALAAGTALATGAIVATQSAAPASAATTHNLFGWTKPTNRNTADTQPVTLGVRFSSSVPGKVTGVRFFKSWANTGTHVGALYTAGGKQLAAATFRNETKSGWQQVTFSQPVTITAGTAYVASYYAPRGHYAGDNGYFAKPKTRGPLTATTGVYKYGTGLPTSTWKSTNYYVDVAFTTSATNPAPTNPAPTATPSPTASPAPTSPAPTSPAPTATPSPTATSGGSAGKLNCVAKPSACGYPDATNTGVQPGVALRSVPGDVTSGKGWSYDPRGWIRVDGDGAVLENLDVRTNIDVMADNVTIRNVRVILGGESFGISVRRTQNTTIENTTITAPDAGANRLLVGIKDIYADSVNLRVLKNNISRASTGVQMSAGLIQDNYIHDLGKRGDDHVNGTTSNGGTTLMTIKHNTILNSHDQTDAISLFQDFGVEANRVIDDNLLAGGGYTIYAGANPGGKQTSNIKVTNNRIAKLYYPKGGSFGPATAYDRNGPGNVWSGNIWDDNGSSISTP